jgi:formate--tetrahydrofolate ligase
MALDPTKHADWEIAEDSETRMKPITEIAKKMGLNDDELLRTGITLQK